MRCTAGKHCVEGQPTSYEPRFVGSEAPLAKVRRRTTIAYLVRGMNMSTKGLSDDKVALLEFLQEELENYQLDTFSNSFAAAPRPLATLPYNSAKVFAYLEARCSGGNNCPDGQFPLDCTHFVCHGLAATDVRVTSPTAVCRSGLCIRVNELATAFSNAVGKIENVKRVSVAEAKRGDFCFIPKWYGLGKDHVMVLAGPCAADGAPVYAHTNNRCGDKAPFTPSDCIFYRIEDR